jgi:hypothetical protein
MMSPFDEAAGPMTFAASRHRAGYMEAWPVYNILRQVHAFGMLYFA